MRTKDLQEDLRAAKREARRRYLRLSERPRDEGSYASSMLHGDNVVAVGIGRQHHSGPDYLRSHFQAESERWGGIIKKAGIPGIPQF